MQLHINISPPPPTKSHSELSSKMESPALRICWPLSIYSKQIIFSCWKIFYIVFILLFTDGVYRMRVCVILKARLCVPMNIGYNEFFKVLYKQIISSTLYSDKECTVTYFIQYRIGYCSLHYVQMVLLFAHGSGSHFNMSAGKLHSFQDVLCFVL